MKIAKNYDSVDYDKWGELEVHFSKESDEPDGVINWQLQLKLRDGEHDSFRKLAAEMIYVTNIQEPDMLRYEWFSNDDGILHINKSCANANALRGHFNNFRKNFADRFFACVDLIGFTVHGQPDEEARKAFDGFGAIYLRDFGGFCR